MCARARARVCLCVFACVRACVCDAAFKLKYKPTTLTGEKTGDTGEKTEILKHFAGRRFRVEVYRFNSDRLHTRRRVGMGMVSRTIAS